MKKRTRLPLREKVFIASLNYHGFKLSKKRYNLKYAQSYVIVSSSEEDGEGIDFWVKMPKDHTLYPIQVTQRGTRILKKHLKKPTEKFPGLVLRAESRISQKREMCKAHAIAFVLLKDFDGSKTNEGLANSDVYNLREAIKQFKNRS